MELYPNAAHNMKEFALMKREVILHYMDQTLKQSYKRLITGIPASLRESE